MSARVSDEDLASATDDGSWESRWPLLPGGSQDAWLYRCPRWHAHLLAGRPIEAEQLLELEVLDGQQVPVRLDSPDAGSLRVFLAPSGSLPFRLRLKDLAFHGARRLRWPSRAARTTRPRKLPAVVEAARLLQQASMELRELDPFRSDALHNLSHCLQNLASARTLELTMPRGELTVHGADGFPLRIHQPAGSTGGYVAVSPRSMKQAPSDS